MTTKKHGDFSQKFSISEWEKKGNLKTMTTLQVTSRGNSLAIVIPRELVEIAGLISHDRVRVWFLEFYRKKRNDDSKDEPLEDQGEL